MSECSDRILNCQDCSAPFAFTLGEQQFFAAKGLKNEPKRCPNCRLVARMGRAGIDTSKASSVPCADCGAEAKIPFQPKGHKPVYCTRCFHARKRGGSSEGERGDADSAESAEIESAPSVLESSSD